MLRILNRALATGFFVGEIPGAPGTYGSLLAVILILFFPSLTTLPFLLIVFFMGIIITGHEEKITEIKDESAIVLDEILGILVTFFGISDNYQIWFLITGFILFRLFDIVKPYPIKSLQKIPGGLGVMIDDLLAGLVSLLILSIIW